MTNRSAQYRATNHYVWIGVLFSIFSTQDIYRVWNHATTGHVISMCLSLLLAGNGFYQAYRVSRQRENIDPKYRVSWMRREIIRAKIITGKPCVDPAQRSVQVEMARTVRENRENLMMIFALSAGALVVLAGLALLWHWDLWSWIIGILCVIAPSLWTLISAPGAEDIVAQAEGQR